MSIEEIIEITGLEEKDLEKIMDKNIVGLYDAEAVERKVRNTQIKGAKLEGIEQGKKEGKKEEKIEIARNLKKMGISIEDISKATLLSIEAIKAIR